HTRPILMLADHPEEQLVLFKEILYKKITVREAERLARKIAYDRVRKKEFMPDPEITELEEEFQEKLGTRVHIDRKELGGQIKIDFFSTEDLRTILDLIHKSGIEKKPTEMLEKHISQNNSETEQAAEAIDDRTKEETQKDDTDLYNISNFSV
ncbi:MAG: ParB-like protein partition protein, partial [Candidatus Nomurabacteria bacterium GW2011_GWA2_41_25]